jgi:hypothetical protein
MTSVCDNQTQLQTAMAQLAGFAQRRRSRASRDLIGWRAGEEMHCQP